MKLAESLQECADLNRKIEQLKTWLNVYALVQECEFKTASDGLDFPITFKASKLYCALERYRREHDDAVVDYNKVISDMDNMPYPDDGSLNSGSGSLNCRKWRSDLFPQEENPRSTEIESSGNR